MREGDRVWGCEDRTGLNCGWRRVHAVIVGDEKPVVEVEVEYADGTHDFLDATPGHPFAVAGVAWVDAADLEPGDRLYTPWGLGASVVGVAPGRGESVVYNLTVAQAHTFFVAGAEGGDGVWVHNACPTWFRYMSRAEADAVKSTGLLRGGRAGETFWTNRVYKTVRGAKRWNALPTRPEVRVRFRMKGSPKLELDGTRVQPANREPGGGREWSSMDPVEVEVLGVDDLD